MATSERLAITKDGILDLENYNVPEEQSNIADRNDRESPLLRLPPEVRTLVFRYVLTGRVISLTIQEKARNASEPIQARGFFAPSQPVVSPAMFNMKVHCQDESEQTLDPLWLVCRRMYAETRNMVFSPLNTFLLFDLDRGQTRPRRAFSLKAVQMKGIQNVIPGNRTVLHRLLHTSTLTNVTTVYCRSSLDWFKRYREKVESVYESDPLNSRRIQRVIDKTLYESDYSWVDWPLAYLCHRWNITLVRSEEPPRLVMKYPHERDLSINTTGEVGNIYTRFLKYPHIARFGNVPSRINYFTMHDAQQKKIDNAPNLRAEIEVA